MSVLGCALAYRASFPHRPQIATDRQIELERKKRQEIERRKADELNAERNDLLAWKQVRFGSYASASAAALTAGNGNRAMGSHVIPSCAEPAYM